MTRANGAGFVIGSAIKSVPIAGKDLTLFVQQLMRERGEKVRFPPPPPTTPRCTAELLCRKASSRLGLSAKDLYIRNTGVLHRTHAVYCSANHPPRHRPCPSAAPLPRTLAALSEEVPTAATGSA